MTVRLETIRAGETALMVTPELGGCVQALRVDGEDVLRPGRPELASPLEMASFPLVPWCNRIAEGVFVWEGRLVDVGGTPLLGEAHGVHGHGWMRRWEVEERSKDRLTLSLLHPAGRWPWRYRARQAMTVEEGRVEQTLTVENLGDEPMPLALGFHPYFGRPARFSATVDGAWVGGDAIPEGWDDRGSFRNHDVDDIECDTTFTGWDHTVSIHLPGFRVELTSDLPMLHVYTPRGRSFFCLEPVGAAPGALNHPGRGDGVLAPGATGAASMRLQVRKA
jgi:aldose 1-epimerase